MARKLRDSVVVITGASSGIGRAAARAFAARGARLMLAARGVPALRETLEECQARGADARAQPTDVTDRDAVHALLRHTVEAFGGVDVWVNNAAVTLFGRLEDTPPDAYDRVIQTNLFGYINGARAVLPLFRSQGHGVLINVSSQVANAPQPYTSAYVTSKAAIRVLSQCLRQELVDAPDVHVSTVLPASIDTPLFQHGANYTGWAVQPMPPVYRPERVARAILSMAERPRAEVFVGGPGKLAGLARMASPALVERPMARMTEERHFQDRPAETSEGNLFAPAQENLGTSGGWRAPPGRRLAKQAPLLAGLAVAALPLGLLAVRSLRLRRPPPI